jgi:hypothetical protein
MKVLKWHAEVDCSRHERQQPEMLGRRRLINVFDVQSKMAARQNVVVYEP